MRFLLILVNFSFVIFFLSSCLNNSKEELLLTSETRSVIKSSQTILAFELEPMLRRPIAMPDTELLREGKVLTVNQKNFLINNLLKARHIKEANRFKTCKFEPGIKFSFFSEDLKTLFESKRVKSKEFNYFNPPKSSFDILLCFNCSVWALPNSSHLINSISTAKKSKIQSFADIKENEEELKNLYNELFPNIAN